MTNDAWMREHTLTDDDGREIVFTGVGLGSATSERPGKDRWTVITIYVTEAGTYIVNVLGRSRRAEDREKSRVAICETPQAVVSSLHQVDDDGVLYLTHTARAAVTAAGQTDAALLEALMVQRVA